MAGLRFDTILARAAMVLAVVAVVGCSNRETPPQSLTVFTAASTLKPMEELIRRFKTPAQLTPVNLVPGPSSGLSKQITEGAAADLFLSADVASVAALAERGLVEKRVDLLGNRLVVIAPTTSTAGMKSLSDLAGPAFAKIGLTEPKVPAGEYARQALTKAGVLDGVAAKAVGGVDVRATLQHAVRGEVDAAIVYATDVQGSSEVRVIYEIPTGDHAPIVYPLVLLKREKPHGSAAALFEFLQKPFALDVFRAAGFSVPATPSR